MIDAGTITIGKINAGRDQFDTFLASTDSRTFPPLWIVAVVLAQFDGLLKTALSSTNQLTFFAELLTFARRQKAHLDTH